MISGSSVGPLRSTFGTADGLPIQRITEVTRTPLTVVDLSVLPADQREREARRALREASGAAFDLTRDVLLRATLIRLGEDEHILLLLSHHIAIDGWSYGLLFRELTAAYDARTRGAEGAWT